MPTTKTAAEIIYPAATITAKITRRGAQSTVPDDEGAVDATVYADGVKIGEATLVPAAYDGKLSMWGDLTNWTDHSIQTWLETVSEDDRSDALDAIESAVQDAAR